MSALEDLRWAIDEIGRHGERAEFLGGAEPQAIESAERELGLGFPPSYREFLARLGAGWFYDEQTYGILRGGEKMVPNAIWATAQTRDSFGLPRRYVLVQEYDDSSALAIDCEAPGPDGECPIVRLWPGETEHLVDSTVADSFGAFFADFVRETIAVFEHGED